MKSNKVQKISKYFSFGHKIWWYKSYFSFGYGFLSFSGWFFSRWLPVFACARQKLNNSFVLKSFVRNSCKLVAFEASLFFQYITVSSSAVHPVLLLLLSNPSHYAWNIVHVKQIFIMYLYANGRANLSQFKENARSLTRTHIERAWWRRKKTEYNSKINNEIHWMNKVCALTQLLIFPASFDKWNIFFAYFPINLCIQHRPELTRVLNRTGGREWVEWVEWVSAEEFFSSFWKKSKQQKCFIWSLKTKLQNNHIEIHSSKLL